MGSRREAGGADGQLLMAVIHQVTSENSDRSTLDLNVRQRLVLQVLGLSGESTPAAVGGRLGFSPSTMTGLLDRLEAQGYLRRKEHPSDRRAYALALTAKGRQAFRREADFYGSLANRILGGLGAADRARVLRSLAAFGKAGRAS